MPGIDFSRASVIRFIIGTKRKSRKTLSTRSARRTVKAEAPGISDMPITVKSNTFQPSLKNWNR